MKSSDFIRPFGRRTNVALSLTEVMRSRPGWFRALPLAASLILLAAPLRAELAFVANTSDNNVSVYTIGSNGALTLQWTFATGNGPGPVTVDPTGRFGYV